MLLEMDGERRRVYVGIGLRARLVRVLGPRRALAVYKQYTDYAEKKDSPQSDRRRLFRAVGATLFGFAFSGLFRSQLQAQEKGPHQIYLPNVAAGPSPMGPQSLAYELLTPEEVDLFIKHTVESGKLSRFLNAIATQFPGYSIQKEPRVFCINGRVIVQYFIEGGPGYSGYEIHFDRAVGQILETRSALFALEGSDVLTQFFVNDDLRLQAVFDNGGQLLHGQAFDSSGKEIDIATLQGIAAQAVAVGWGCINNCLSSLGLPSWLLGVLAVICAVLCAATAGWGCYLCIAGAGYGYYLEAFYCVDKCCNYCLSRP